jgi:hypothetical protein
LIFAFQIGVNGGCLSQYVIVHHGKFLGSEESDLDLVVLGLDLGWHHNGLVVFIGSSCVFIDLDGLVSLCCDRDRELEVPGNFIKRWALGIGEGNPTMQKTVFAHKVDEGHIELVSTYHRILEVALVENSDLNLGLLNLLYALEKNKSFIIMIDFFPSYLPRS